MSGLRAYEVAGKGSVAGRVGFAAVRACAGTLLAAGVLAGLAGLLALDVPVPALALLACAGAAVASAVAAAGPRGALAAPAVAFAAGALAVVAVCGDAGPLEGARALWTSFAAKLADVSAWRLPELALADPQGRDANAARFVLACAPLACSLCCALAGARRPWWLVALVPFWAFVAGVDGWVLPAGAVAAVAIGAALCMGLSVPREASAAARGVMTPARCCAAGVAALVAAVAVGAFAIAMPPGAWNPGTGMLGAREAAGAAIHGARYGGQPNALPDGDFSRLEAWRSDDATALQVVADDLQPAYLRGFVGAQYDVKGWHALPESDYHASDALFYWLHAEGFDAKSQLAETLDAALGDAEAARQLSAADSEVLRRLSGGGGAGAGADGAEAGSARQPAEGASPSRNAEGGVAAHASFVQVRNERASSEWLYLPYGLVALEGGGRFLDRADETAAPRGIFGERAYSFTNVWGLDATYPDVAALSWIARDDAERYWELESNYNAFAYERYGRNSESAEEAVTKVLGEAGLSEGAHVDYAAAASTVASWLAENVTYDETYGAPAGADVLADVLSGEKRGWSAHFATAAVAMLRHYGIPARYVEGYLVKPADIAAAGAGQGAGAAGAGGASGASGSANADAASSAAGASADASASQQPADVSVPAANGHAWAEMYVDGTGWVPVETVPRVRAEMPQPDWARGIQANGRVREATPPDQQTVQAPDTVTQMAEMLRDALEWLATAILAILIAFDVLALLLFLVVLARRLLARRARRIAFSQEDDTAATRSMAAWMAELARFRFPQIPAGDARGLAAALEGAYGDDVASGWREAQAWGRKAAFSRDGATHDERTQVAEAARRFAEAVGKAEGAHARFTMKYIERLL